MVSRIIRRIYGFIDWGAVAITLMVISVGFGAIVATAPQEHFSIEGENSFRLTWTTSLRSGCWADYHISKPAGGRMIVERITPQDCYDREFGETFPLTPVFVIYHEAEIEPNFRIVQVRGPDFVGLPQQFKGELAPEVERALEEGRVRIRSYLDAYEKALDRIGRRQ